MTKGRILIAFLFVISFINFISSQDYFGFELNCFQGCNNEKSDINQKIILELTLKNNFEYWVKISGNSQYLDPSIKVNLIIENYNLKEGKGGEEHAIIPPIFYVSPKSEFKFYFPLDSYNNLEKEKRGGEWKINPKIAINGIEYYQSPFDDTKQSNIKTEYRIPTTLIGSQVKFQAEGEKIQITRNPISSIWNLIPSGFKNWTSGILATIIAGFIIYYITRKK